MIVSAVSLWKKFHTKTPLSPSEWGIEERDGTRFSHVSYSGHAAEDGSVRVYAWFWRPLGEEKKPTILLLPDAGKPLDKELAKYFVDKGYGVLMPDYSGRMKSDTEDTLRTVYPPSLEHGNYEKARGLKDMEKLSPEQTTWFEWTYLALFSIEYLKSRPDVGNIGIVGVREGGAIAWQTMLSPDIRCAVPINAVGWTSFSGVAKFGQNVAHHLSDDRHKYIAAVEAQSYAPYVKCPVLMLCALHDDTFDCDRAYDTYSRIGNEYGNALIYSASSGACIGQRGLLGLDLFLEKHLKGREIYIPAPLNVQLTETAGGLHVEIECDKEGLLEEAGIFYAEASLKTKCAYRDWHRVYKVNGKSVKDGKVTHMLKPFAGAEAAFVYAYAKYLNGFRVVSKITAKRLTANKNAVKGRMLYSGKELDCFGVANYDRYSIANVFLEGEAVVKNAVGYGGIRGAFSLGGIKTYKISSPEFVPDDNALLKFDAYFSATDELKISVDAGDVERERERYTCALEVKGGGKWKRLILKASDFKGEQSNMPLQNFSEGRALSFDCENEDVEFAINNILWL